MKLFSYIINLTIVVLFSLSFVYIISVPSLKIKIAHTIGTNILLPNKEKEVYAELQHLIDKIDIDNWSKFDIEIFVHDYIVNKAEYDLVASNSQEAYGVLIDGRAACAGYAKTFDLVMYLLNIPSKLVTGVAANQKHMWNLVKLDDGNWYHVDITWDASLQDSGYVSHIYLNRTDEEMKHTHTWKMKTNATSNKYTYYLTRVKSIKSSSDLNAIVAFHASKNIGLIELQNNTISEQELKEVYYLKNVSSVAYSINSNLNTLQIILEYR